MEGAEGAEGTDLQQAREPEQRVHPGEVVQDLHGKQAGDVHLQTRPSGGRHISHRFIFSFNPQRPFTSGQYWLSVAVATRGNDEPVHDDVTRPVAPMETISVSSSERQHFLR